MPSHSAKQHRFMEAIAHSPSFAKKAGVPQSVGKDYAAADKGKTFSKGGEMKESKGMVGKEVAFFKKKGAPKSMIKHEMSEMKRGGKVRRMAGGGMGDPFERDTDYETEKAQGAKNLEGIKSFFGFGKKKEEETPSMTMDNPPPSSGARVNRPTASSAPANGGRRPLPVSSTSSQSPRTRRGNEDTSDSDAVERSDAAMLAASRDKTAKGPQYTSNVNQGETDFGYESQRGPKVTTGAAGFGQTPYEDSGFSAVNKKPAKRSKPIGVEKTVKQERVITAPNDNSYASMEERRAKASENRMLDKKPGAMTRQMREAPTGEQLWAGQKSMGDEIGDVLKSFRASIRGGLKSAAEKRQMREAEAHVAKGGRIKAYAEGGKVKKMAFGGDTGQPMRGGPRPAPEAPINPNSIAYLQSKYGMRPQGGPPMKAGGKVKRMYDGGPPEMGPQPKSARLTLSEPEPQSARLTLSPEAPRGGGLAKLRQAIERVPEPIGKASIGFDEGQGYGNRGPQPQPMQNRTPELPPERAPTPIERMPYQEPERQMPKMPDGEMVPRSPIEPPPREPKLLPGQKPEELFGEINRRMYSGMMQPSRPEDRPRIGGPGIKAGGQVKKMAQGGFTREADGIAKKGKTQGKVVKMAKGGFVKTADGCAQRGKTKAFQVKMNRGGMC